MTRQPIEAKPSPYLAQRPTRSINPWFIRLPILTVTGSTLLALLLVIFVGLFRITYTDRVTLGVSAYGIDLGGMTQEEAASRLAAQFTYDDAAIFTFRDGERFWQMSAVELGFYFDAEETANRALAVGQDSNLFTGLFDQGRSWFKGQAIAPILHYDQGIALERLMEIAAEIDRAPQDAQLIVDGVMVTTTAGQAGRVLDIMATLAYLDQALLSMSNGTEMPLVIHEQEPAIWNADEAANTIRAALSGPLELIANGTNGEHLGPWSISIEQIAALLVVDLIPNPDGTQRYQVGINTAVFTESLNTLAPGLLALAKDGRFHFDDNTGVLEVIQPPTNGRELNIEETLAQIEQAVFRYDNRSVPIAFTYTQPRYHNNITAAELGIAELVAESTTYYTGSGANRRHNIAQGASRFDGVIIGPGEEFSFNYWLGDVSLEAGFVESKVIEGERTVDGVGGGICQVSTTAFRAAFAGGFTVIERNSHAYRVGFYELNNAPPGLDAAIWTPERDFRFQNDTPYHLLIETSVYPASNALQFRFYSTNPGRVVEIQEPIIRNNEPPLETRYEPNAALQQGEAIQVDWAASGADVTIRRVIRDSAGNELRRDEIYTHYLPWRAIIQVAPGDPRLSSSSDG